MGKTALIVGLGNPGTMYEMTRHNIGALVLKAFASRFGWKFKRSLKLKGKVASGVIHATEIRLLLPTTFMNLSGVSVRRAVDHFRIEQSRLLVLSDDVHLSFGKMRFRETGSPGGHNGLKSIEQSLHSKDYPRLKIGIGDKYFGDLAEYVLSPFEEEEVKQFPQIKKTASDFVDLWIQEKIDKAKELLIEPAAQKGG